MLERRFMNEISGMLIAIPARFHKASPENIKHMKRILIF
jgi:hypothetical protein